MNKNAKIVVTIIIVFVFIFLSLTLASFEVRKTFIGLLALGLYFGLQAVWKKDKKKDQNPSDNIKLDKSNN